MPTFQNDLRVGPLDVHYEPVTVRYDENAGAFTDGERLYPYDTLTRATVNTDGLNFTMPTPTFDYLTLDHNYINRDEFEYRLNELKSNIYKIISEHSKLDISEEEFMNLLKE